MENIEKIDGILEKVEIDESMTIKEIQHNLGKSLSGLGGDPKTEITICFGKEAKRRCWKIFIKEVPAKA